MNPSAYIPSAHAITPRVQLKPMEIELKEDLLALVVESKQDLTKQAALIAASSI
jgi:hypothetical protein